MAEKIPTHVEALATRYETPAREPSSQPVASSGHDRALRDRLGDQMRDRTQSPERGKKSIVTNTIRHVISDQGLDLAAGLAFYALLSMAPATLALVSMLGVVGEAKSTTEAVLGLASDLSAEAAEAVRPLVTELASSPAAGLTLIASVAVAIWSSSKYVGAFGRAANRAYAVEETRPLWKLKPMMLFITLVLLLLMAGLGLLLVVSGPIAESIGRLVGLGPVAVMIWSIARWPVVIFFVMLLIALLYYATPNVKKSKFRWSSIGAFVALITLILVSLGFVLYINNFDNYNATYGAIGGVIVGFAWLWMVNLALIFGAELDAEIERSRTSD
ncbi:YihY/virulence factor BrkB family protein [Brevibacterium sp. UCMA 11752]|uniref:YihY/virulence factor BrkB family protein n=1 Tax=Brevibacterium sp. UCMA 11752 TaxID=2745946 RepID=UPI001F208D10|nr:YihY/virulence factor BrkB family protein [Brevibacterium sp. UCMA 11752]MCF2587084.1 YihY/virulence factor BrkB family protein [Brevibacterium sp. UCMA 11752]